MRVFVDVETTGIDPADNYIVEVGVVLYDGYKRVENGQFHSFVNPDMEVIPVESYKIHGLNKKFLSDHPRFGQIAAEVAEAIRGHEFLAHNAEFDVSFLDAELVRAGQPPVAELATSITDTLALARKMYPHQRNSLDALAKRFGVDTESRRDRHGALIDAQLLAAVYERMIEGQSDLNLDSVTKDLLAAVPHPDRIEIVPLPPDAAAHARHDEYLAQMQERSGVRPVALEPPGE